MRRACSMSSRLALAALRRCAGCNNSPYPRRRGGRPTRCSTRSTSARRATSTRPRRTGNHETPYTYQIYEPLYGYHYLKRPYELVPEDGAEVVKPLLPRQGRQAACPTTRRPSRSPRASTTIRIKPGILYQPHPAFAQGRARARYRYHRPEAGRARRQALAAGLRAAGHARAGRRGLRLRAQAPRHDAHHDADLSASSPSTCSA